MSTCLVNLSQHILLLRLVKRGGKNWASFLSTHWYLYIPGSVVPKKSGQEFYSSSQYDIFTHYVLAFRFAKIQTILLHISRSEVSVHIFQITKESVKSAVTIQVE